MERETFWAPEAARETAAFPTGIRAGQWLFLSAQLPRSLETGALLTSLWDLPSDVQAELTTGFEHRDGREGAIRAQTWQIYRNLADILDRFDTGVENIIRQRIYVRHRHDIPPMEETMLGFFDRELPATTIARMGSDNLHPELRVQVDVVALVPEPGGLERSEVRVPALSAVTSPYPLAVRGGQLLFFSGIRGIDPDTGRTITTLAELDSESRSLVATDRYHTDTNDEALVAQHALVFRHLREILESVDGELDNLVRQNYFTTATMSTWGFVSQAFRDHMYSGQERAPGVTTPSVRAIGGDREAAVLCDAVALLSGEWKDTKHVVDRVEMGYLPMVTEAGPFVFTTGYIGMDKEQHRSVTDFDELTKPGNYLGSGRPDDTEVVTAQAWHTYGVVEDLLGDVGCHLDEVVHQTVYMRDLAEYAALERVASVKFDGSLPPTTVVGVTDVGPYEGLRFEVDMIAVR